MRLVIYGDSISRGYGVAPDECWAALLTSLLSDVEVFNAGGNGNTSSEGLARFDADVLPHLPAIVFVEFGGNDAVEGARHVPPDQFRRNLIEIHSRISAAGGHAVPTVFPPVVDDRHANGHDAFYGKWGGLDNCVAQYRSATREMAGMLNLPLFDMDALLRPLLPSRPELLLADGVHLSAAGNKFVAGRAAELIGHL